VPLNIDDHHTIASSMFAPTPEITARARAVLAKHADDFGWTAAEVLEAEQTLGIEEVGT
jgi:hypothetical protein